MTYTVKRIASPDVITNCPLCPIDQYNWGGEYRPRAFGQLGLLPGSQLAVHLWCEERNPARSYQKAQDPVYLDSALEFFFAPSDKDGYYNFEINANGALLCQYGSGKEKRTALPSSLRSQILCSAKICDTYWKADLLLPLPLFTDQPAEPFHFNFYKIKESPGKTHFASYTRILSETPNFHLPQFFAEAAIEG